MYIKKVVSVMVALGLLVTLNTSVLADSLSDTIKQKESKEKQLQQQNNSLKQAEDKVQSLEMTIEDYDTKIEGLMSTLDDNKKDIAKSEADIAQAKLQVDQAQKDIVNQQQLFGERMRALYKNGTQSYVEIILEAKGFTDLISRIEAIDRIAEFDKNVEHELLDKKAVLDEKKAALDDDNKQLLAIEAKNEQELASLSQNKSDEKKLIDEAKKQQALLVSNVQDTQNEIATAEKRIKALRAAAPRYTPPRPKPSGTDTSTGNSTGTSSSSGAAPVSPDNLVVYASNFLGTPYVWGGTTPVPGFDCSGFVQYVYAHFGIHISRTTYTQINEGVEVSRDQLQPGDLIFFGTWDDPHHVGMYVGNNCYIQAPETGDVVKISPLTRPDYLTARRILQN